MGSPVTLNSTKAASQFWAFIALGSNAGDSVSLLENAFHDLRRLTGLPLRCSSLYRTEPVDCPPGSPWFLNAVAGLAPCRGETPESLLAKLQALEKEAGRTPKKVHNEPRPLDLDLIAFGQECRHTQVLTLPHPRALQRRFVLEPMAEIAPDFVFPGQTLTVLQILQQLGSREKVQRLPPGTSQKGPSISLERESE